jgi:ribA/ribD-fused uncharacterized protein
MIPIRSFQGEHAWLSNFYPAEITTDGMVFPTAEHVYQATKSSDPKIWEMMQHIPLPAQAKKFGSKLVLRANWHEMKLEYMTKIVTLKFEQHPDLMAKLIATGSRELVEDNTWNDTFWGVCRGIGDNHLGKILMKIRSLNSVENKSESS